MPNVAVVGYNSKVFGYERLLDANYKKTNGIFYTDTELATKILDELDIFPSSIVVDPCCGMGSFIIAALQKGVRSVYGADIDKSVLAECVTHLDGAKLTPFDTIGNQSSRSIKALEICNDIDFVVGNPPYASQIYIKSTDSVFLKKVAGSGSNLFVAALIRALEMVKKGGIVSYIIPKNFLHVAVYSLLRREILKEKTIISIIDIGAYFKNVRGEQIIISIKNELPLNNKVHIKKLIDGNFLSLATIQQDFYTDEILLFSSTEEFSIYKKLQSSHQMMQDICKGYMGRGKSVNKTAITGKEIRKFGYKNTPLPITGNKILIQNIYSAESGIIAAFGGELEAAQTVTVFTDGNEKMCRYILGILHSRLCNYFLYRFCFNSSSLTMHTDAKYIKKIPLAIKDGDSFEQILTVVKILEQSDYMSDAWYNHLELLNTLIYNIYGMSNEERDSIDNIMKKVQSKRWLKHGG